MVIDHTQEPAPSDEAQPLAVNGPALAEDWALGRFFTAPDLEPCPAVIDLAGPPRHLFYGPWARLEPGLWRATLVIELSEDASDCRLAVEFGSDQHGWTLAETPAGRAGLQEIVLDHVFLADDEALLRVLLRSSAAGGQLRFVSAKAHRLGDATLALSPTTLGHDEGDRVQIWDRARFFTAPDLDPCPETIDLTGRARHLFYGPWADLEPGLWRATLLIELCEDAARRLIAVEFGADERGWTLVDVPPGAAGVREVVLEHAFQPGDQALLRVLLKAAAFHGTLRFISAVAERLGDAPDPAEPAVTP